MYENEDAIDKWKRKCSELLSSDGNDLYLKDVVWSKEMYSDPSVKAENLLMQLVFEMYLTDTRLRLDQINEYILHCCKDPAVEIIGYHGVIETISPPQLETCWGKNPKEMTNALAEGFINYSKEDLKCCQLPKKDR